jgi:hypothetical protein
MTVKETSTPAAIVDQPGIELADDLVIQEEDWGLPMDFHLFAQHQQYAITLGPGRGANAATPPSLVIECVESVSVSDFWSFNEKECF